MRGHDLSNRVARLERRVAYLLQFAPKTVTAGVATFALTGSTANLLNSARFLDAGAASYAMTGQAATLRRSLVVAGGATSYALSGQTAALNKGIFLAADAASFALAGTDAGFAQSRAVSAEAASFSLTGQDATLGSAASLVAEPGSYSIAGSAGTLRHGRLVVAGAASFSLAGQAASTLRKAKVTAAAGSFALTGQAATLTIASASDLTLFALATANASTVTTPTGIANGDVGVLVDYSYGLSGTPTAVTPSGYTNRASVAHPDGNQRVMVSTKVLTTADDSVVLTGMNGNTNRKRLFIFRHVSGLSGITPSSITSTSANGSDPAAAAASYTGLSGSSITIGILASIFNGSPSSPTFSPTATGSSVANSLNVYYLLTDAGDPGSVSVDQGGTGPRAQNILLNLEVS